MSLLLYLGTHLPNWLGKTDVPLFVSHRRLAGRRSLPRASGRWALDSGGFTELSMHGAWQTTASEYVTATRRYADEIGNLDWAAPQDWMCEPFMLDKTGLTVAEHQRRTVRSVQELRDLAPDLPFIPVLQGWVLDDYLRCVDLYAKAGFDLASEPTVGIGSVCRRQSETQIEDICAAVASRGIALHGFGVKTLGMRYARHLVSADSMAWSYNARMNPPMPGCHHGKSGRGSCANCIRWALRWRERAIRRAQYQQPTLWEMTG